MSGPVSSEGERQVNYVHPEYLIEPAALAAKLEQPDLRVFDATVHLVPAERGYRAESGKADYDQAHIAGAVFLDQLRALSDTTSGLGFTLPEASVLQAVLRDAGINTDSDVVVYSSGHMMWATRAWWLLHYAGVGKVAVLNGGFRSWQDQALPVSSEAASYPAGNFEGAIRKDHFVDKQAVLNAIGSGSICTVNALAPDVYAGTAKMSYGRKGHITGSINVHYDTLLDKGRFLPADALRDVLDKGGLLGPERVYAYCGGGISATIDAFACKLVGKEDVAVYDGSMSEWVRDEALPMTEGQYAG